MLAELAEIRERTTIEASAANPELLAILTKLDKDAAQLTPAMATDLRRMGTYSFFSTLLDKFFDKLIISHWMKKFTNPCLII